MRAEKGNPAPERIYERRRDGNKIADEEKSEKNSRTRCGKEKCKQPRFNTWVPKEGEEAHFMSFFSLNLLFFILNLLFRIPSTWRGTYCP